MAAETIPIRPRPHAAGSIWGRPRSARADRPRANNFALPASSFMTGAVLVVDGGVTIRNA